jgi:hypothetical protein
MSMADIWLTAAARGELGTLPGDQRQAVGDVIGGIGAREGRPLDIPGAPAAAPFLALEPENPRAPVVIYRRTIPGEPGDWLVVSLLRHEDYDAARHAEQTLEAAPPAVRQFIKTAVAGRGASGDVGPYLPSQNRFGDRQGGQEAGSSTRASEA